MGARRVRRRGAGRHGQHRGSAGRRARHRPRQQLHQLPPRRFLGADHHLPPALCGDLASLLASLVIGATSLRLSGTSFTFATLFFQELVLLLLRKLPFAGGPGGLVLEEIFPVSQPYLLMMAAATGATLVVLVLRS